MAGVTMSEFCARLRNYFTAPCDRHPGHYRISGGALAPCAFLTPGQYFRIIGSHKNDGVHKFGASPSGLSDEEFTGCIWAMSVPAEAEELFAEISAWQNTYGAAADSPYSFESFGGYSYSKPARRTDAYSAETFGWWGTFSGRLARWRKQSV